MAADVREAVPPRLHPLTLRLMPSCYERQFRASRTFQETARLVDICSLTAAAAETVAYLRWNQRYSGLGYSTRQSFGLLFLAMCAVQLVWMNRHQRSYYHYHGSLYIFNRIIRLAHVCTIPYFTHVALAGSPAPQHTSATAAPPDVAMSAAIVRSFSKPLTHPLFTTIKLILLASGAVAAFLPAISIPLPFALQIAFQLATTVLFLAYQAPPATRLLAHMLPPGGTQQQVCHALNRLLYMLECLHVGSSSEVPLFSQQCEAHATRMLVIAMLLYFGLVLPVYLSYRLERYRKGLYLQREHGQWHGPSDALLVDTLLLSTLALVVWMMVLQLHGHLPA